MKRKQKMNEFPIEEKNDEGRVWKDEEKKEEKIAIDNKKLDDEA